MRSRLATTVFALCMFGVGVTVASGQARPATPAAAPAAPAKASSKAPVKPGDVPSQVRLAFRDRFPTVTNASWTLKSTDKTYEAEFLDKGSEVTVKFDGTGKWLETESAMPAAQVPAPIRSLYRTRFAGYSVTETQTMRRWDDELPIYELHFENAKDVLKVQFHADGRILSQSSKPKAGR